MNGTRVKIDFVMVVIWVNKLGAIAATNDSRKRTRKPVVIAEKDKSTIVAASDSRK